MDWPMAIAGLAVLLGTVAITVLLTVPWACRRCQGDEEDERPTDQTDDARRTRWQ